MFTSIYTNRERGYMVELERYEYLDKDTKGNEYTCSFTIKKGVKSPIPKAKLVETFKI